ncbi:DUF541 domain-containing protein [Natronorubrum sp. JWXQ-INN-674]|uniref:DUF541 domain-containing protein n=1 Tax=Natronorubrum halalkaliphilum TaxID=2691917 RepID=A0A6B0VS44_9EURY|nr:SIMPL domain-containing protein [Natronorubrum halalkaliphilum]MXV63953.1 DUF541 domain-containing protein [Natronorubrum halalkaliphilum]
MTEHTTTTDRTITTNATASCETAPELARIAGTVTGDGDTATVARSTARDRVSTIRDSLTDISAVRIQIVNRRIEHTSEMFEPETDAQYQATERLQIECAPETAADVVVEVTDAGSTIQSVEFGLQEKSRRELRNDALAEAMNRARKRAESIAAAEGVAVGSIRDVTTDTIRVRLRSEIDRRQRFDEVIFRNRVERGCAT